MTKVFTLNQGQQQAADDLFKWLLDPDNKHIILSGPGGVGKSYLISYLVDILIPQYKNTCAMLNIEENLHTVNLTAMSNPASQILAEGTGRPVSTLHSFLNLRVKNDYSTGKTKLIKSHNWKVHSNLILIIDEYSMEDKEVFDLINEGTFNCKVIHVGDHCQLAAVGDKIPYVSTLPIPRIDLTEQMRNKGQPALQSLCADLRKCVETGKFCSIDLVPGVVELLDGNQWEQAITDVFPDVAHIDDQRIVAYSNARVNMYNGFIRSLRNLPAEPTEGEELISSGLYTKRVGKQTYSLSTEEPVKIIRIHSGEAVIDLPDEGKLPVVYADVQGQFTYIPNVPIPLDRAHLQELIKYYKRTKNWSTYFYLKEQIPDLRPKDSCTIHKSQGSSVDTVYIDLDDLSSCTVTDTAMRLLYVAVSRARNKVVFYGKLTPRLGKINV